MKSTIKISSRGKKGTDLLDTVYYSFNSTNGVAPTINTITECLKEFSANRAKRTITISIENKKDSIS